MRDRFRGNPTRGQRPLFATPLFSKLSIVVILLMDACQKRRLTLGGKIFLTCSATGNLATPKALVYAHLHRDLTEKQLVLSRHQINESAEFVAGKIELIVDKKSE